VLLAAARSLVACAFGYFAAPLHHGAMQGAIAVRRGCGIARQDRHRTV